MAIEWQESFVNNSLRWTADHAGYSLYIGTMTYDLTRYYVPAVHPCGAHLARGECWHGAMAESLDGAKAAAERYVAEREELERLRVFVRARMPSDHSHWCDYIDPRSRTSKCDCPRGDAREALGEPRV